MNVELSGHLTDRRSTFLHLNFCPTSIRMDEEVEMTMNHQLNRMRFNRSMVVHIITCPLPIHIFYLLWIGGHVMKSQAVLELR